MLIGYVSDEWFMALPGALVEIGDVVLRSGPSGAVHADLEPGEYEVALAAEGHGPKRVRASFAPGRPVQFRLLSDRPYGYAWPKWVRAGELAQLRIHAACDYEVDLWRHGWEREHVTSIGTFEDHPPRSLRQVLPDADVAATGTDWVGSWSFPPVDPRLTVQAPERGGLYFFHLRDHSGRHTSWPWVVAPWQPTSRIAVLASTLTWNAYNDFGGRSNYTAAIRLPERPSVDPHHEDVWFTDPARPPWDAKDYDPLSFDRPEPTNRTPAHEQITDPIVTRGAEHLAAAEWRLLGWLEREGFAHDLWADVQLATGELPLDAYDVLVISTHPEYWTRGMYAAVTAWVRKGGRLASLGGNGINCEVELAEDGRMRVRNDDWRTFPDPGQSRFSHRVESEAHLLGVVTTMSGYETGAPYRVVDGSHWAFAGTGLRSGDLFGSESLDRRAVGGASGHETDKRTPATPSSAVLLAKGTNPDDGGGDMLHLTLGGGEVFAVGSISYTCAIAVDDLVSRVTANVLRRFLADG